ncbi:hypothetical protein K450DRAFT_229310 [Umbelopsis ramanniana AG]|uniref:Uncharacterized protein n=1 Tax=Umbelopsis ramanniana AG TaxID=1314678 RepID=A0AAD5EFV4_UMBRA|nr:uncharacterized protein K450DRAFT_229310 [Umbelopsis ramanniana AG]KAI8582161.1 hypothetical protein K450DRAFT_229310 [Umbelopsis ramanniana AG]
MDRKRVNGPELSVVPVEEHTEEKQILDSKERRLDGRGIDDIRPIFMKSGLISQANGSTYMEFGNAKVVCAVYGPRQMKKPSFTGKGVLNCEIKFATFSCKKRRAFQRDAQEKEFSQILVQALTPAVRLDLLPKSSIDVYVNVLENDGTSSTLAAAISAASVALADAGIEMYDQVAASSIAYVQNKILMDPSALEEESEDGSLVVSYMPSLNEITHILQNGNTESAIANKAVEQCIDACSKIYSVMSTVLLQSLDTSDK